MTSNICVIYSYYEGNEEYKRNLQFFLKNAYIDDQSIDFYLIINGKTTLQLPVYSNLFIFHRQNEGYDFGAYNYIIKLLYKKYDYYIFVNCSTRGPFLPSYYKSRWYQPFVDQLCGDVKLVGPTINACTLFGDFRPHVQSYMFALDNECFMFLQKEKFFENKYLDKMEVILKQEVGLSQLILAHGWNISCLVPEYQKIDYRSLNKALQEQILPTDPVYNGDIVYPGKACFGRDLHPYELIFIKTNRGLSPHEIESLTRQNISK